MSINAVGNKIQQYNFWTVGVATSNPETPDFFQLKSKDTKTPEQYNADLAKLAEEYIAEYDSDGDKQVSFDEFWNKDYEELKSVFPNPDTSLLEKAKQTLKLSFDRLNANNTEKSKEKLDKNEIMNFFFTMDSLTPVNGNWSANGVLSKDEYIIMNSALSDTENGDGETIATLLKNNFNAIFKNIK